MVLKARITVELLLRLKSKYGDLNKALILEYVQAYGLQSENKIAQDVGLNRAVVRRALQDLSDSDR
jgi:predicted ArsR family transcriptional regulator